MAFLTGKTHSKIVHLAAMNLKPEHFYNSVALALYERYMKAYRENNVHQDLLSWAIDMEQAEQRLFLAEILQKGVNRERVIPDFTTTIQKMLDRYWIKMREGVKKKIYSGQCDEAEVLELARQFDQIKRCVVQGSGDERSHYIF